MMKLRERMLASALKVISAGISMLGMTDWPSSSTRVMRMVCGPSSIRLKTIRSAMEQWG
ncbi:MAG: hypothetical protein RI897_870 [Verrucomicrobiota bacterium]